jgi:L-lactate dehydrogenase complex protein LldG
MEDNGKSAILGRIRGTLGVETTSGAERERLRKEDWAQIPRRFRRNGTVAMEERISLFRAILKHYGAASYTTSTADVVSSLTAVLQERKKKRMVVPDEFPADWIPRDIEVARDAGLTNEMLDKIEGVLTGCTVAIASTGTIVLASGHDGRRALTLVPDYQMCVVRGEQIVEFMPEGLELLQPLKTCPLTFFSGPSATVDIEMTRVQGVHGPRTLDVVIISS